MVNDSCLPGPIILKKRHFIPEKAKSKTLLDYNLEENCGKSQQKWETGIFKTRLKEGLAFGYDLVLFTLSFL